MKKASLIKAAKELNKVLVLEPKIDTSAKKGDLMKLIKEASEFVEEEDQLSKKTRDVIYALLTKQP